MRVTGIMIFLDLEYFDDKNIYIYSSILCEKSSNLQRKYKHIVLFIRNVGRAESNSDIIFYFVEQESCSI